MIDKIKQLRELLAKATPGPWEERPVEYKGTWDVGSSTIYHWPWSGENIIRCNGRPDAQLIAAAINILPKLLNELERLYEREEESRQLGMELDLLG